MRKCHYSSSNMSLFNFNSHHLVINPDPGPALKCAPGHDSIKDSSMIKSYWLKVGLVHFQNKHTWFLYFRRSTSTSMSAENEFPGNSFSAFNWSPILQVSRLGYIVEIGSSSSPGFVSLGNSLPAFRAVWTPETNSQEIRFRPSKKLV